MSTLTEKGKFFSSLFFLVCLEKIPCASTVKANKTAQKNPTLDTPAAPKPLTSIYLLLLSDLFMSPLRPA